ncbi:hypothetical protein BSKO_12808 [Bryopsis sp. KO-2023]|nr:hypothetical protein BSKO_12808 [Bryopsis sp. KO-2023]
MQNLNVGCGRGNLLSSTTLNRKPISSTITRMPYAKQGPILHPPLERRRGTIGSVSTSGEPVIDSDASEMFCFQCEQTAHGQGCTKIGICGKTPDTAVLQDLLMYSLKGLGGWAHFARSEKGLNDPDINAFVKAAAFSTLTNVNLDETRFQQYIVECHELTNRLRETMEGKSPETPDLIWFDSLPHPFKFNLFDRVGPNPSVEDLVAVGKAVDLKHRRYEMQRLGIDTLLGLHELLTYGLKGLAAYSHHAEVLGHQDPEVDAFCQEALAFLASSESEHCGPVLDTCLRLGETNLKAMRNLDAAHSARFGIPQPTTVHLTPRKGKAILVSGHDLGDLEDLLKQTEGKDINIYTHGEMLPAHGYSKLHKYSHLAGHYGGAWYKQRKEFSKFPGPILMTSNCIVVPWATYSDRMFTTGEVGMPGVEHLQEKDFSKIVETALEMSGFDEEPAGEKTVVTGYGHHAVMGVADKLIDAIKEGHLEHIFLVGGCDAPEQSRKYYGDVVSALPQNTIVLTLGCGKFRFFDQDLGVLPGSDLPRLMDMGQCNDAYSAITVASELAGALHKDINELPLSLDISWFEQKAVSILLTLLHLGVRNIRLGPTLPAFLTNDAVCLLIDEFGLKVADVKHPEKDVELMMQGN